MKYNFNEQEVTYSQIEDLAEDIIDNLDIGSEGFTSISVVIDEKITQELLKVFMRLDFKTINFTPEIIDINTVDYCDLYYFNVCNDGSICIEKACNQNYLEDCSKYLYLESDIVFLNKKNISNDLMKIVENNNIIIFEFQI